MKKKKFRDDGYPRMWYGLSGPRDWVIVHNHILHTVDMALGVNGIEARRRPRGGATHRSAARSTKTLGPE
jgi:hypothetical protein